MDEIVRVIGTWGPGGVVAAALIFGYLVPKAFYDREVKRGDTATEAASKNSDALVGVTTALTVVSNEVVALRSEVASLKEIVADLREELIRKGVG